MKVLMISGSPHKDGSTKRALLEIEKELTKKEIETIFYQIPLKPLQSCTACGLCRNSKDNLCTINDCVNEIIALVKECDGIVVGSPVHFAGITGGLKIVLDRLFYCARPIFMNKPFVGVVIARRAGTTSALEQLNKYPIIAHMLLLGSQYWPMVFGNNALELEEDPEGLQVMRSLGRRMAWVVKMLSDSKQELPVEEEGLRTNFVKI